VSQKFFIVLKTETRSTENINIFFYSVRMTFSIQFSCHQSRNQKFLSNFFAIVNSFIVVPAISRCSSKKRITALQRKVVRDVFLCALCDFPAPNHVLSYCPLQSVPHCFTSNTSSFSTLNPCTIWYCPLPSIPRCGTGDI